MDAISTELLLILAIGVPTALITLVNSMVSRYGSGSKALQIAVAAQQTVNDNYAQLSTDFRMTNQKVEKERREFEQDMKVIRADLSEAKSENTSLRSSIDVMKASHSAEIRVIRAESSQEIESMKAQLTKLEADMNDIRGQLDQAKAEKKALLNEKQEIESEKQSLEDRVAKMMNVQRQIEVDMSEMRASYETRISELQAEIKRKDDLIDQLMKQFKEQDDENKQSVEAVDGGGDPADADPASNGSGSVGSD